MRLSTKGRYAVTAMVDIAQNSGGRPVALNEIAQRQSISLSYLEQLFAKLRRAELVRSVRGPGGGYVLSRAGDEIRISEIVVAVDAVKHTAAVAGNNANGAFDHVGAQDLWAELDQVIAAFLGSITIDDVCQGKVQANGSIPAEPPTYSAAAQ